MKSLTIAYTTARKEPKVDWFLESLVKQSGLPAVVDVLIIDHMAQPFGGWTINNVEERRRNLFEVTSRLGLEQVIRWLPQKPNVFSGPHKLTKDEWWSKSSDLNSAICLAKGSWLACVDDRSVLMPGWLDAIKRAMKGNYAVCGSYEKRSGMTVENGVITNLGTVIGKDPRKQRINSPMWKITGGQWFGAGQWFGCTNALPLEWALQVNGYDESCDGMRYEDTTFGNMLLENKFPVKYDPLMAIVEDRTPGFDVAVKSMDKGVSPADKSHSLLKRVHGKKQATHHWNLREIRERVLRGEPFPMPDQPTHDWYDNQPLIDFP
jgi:hypothetical protein